MSVSRRRFLELGTLAVAATALPSQVAHAAKPGSSRVALESPIEPPLKPPIRTQSEVVSLNYMTKDTFAGLVNSTFSARDSAGKLFNLTLVSAEDLSAPINNEAPVLRVPNPAKQVVRTNTFVLRFLSQSGKPLAQGTYSFNHMSLGTFALFIVPAGGSQPYCTATFSKM